MTDVRAVHVHELRAGDVFSADPPNSPVFMVVGRELVSDGGAGNTIVTLSVLSRDVTSEVEFGLMIAGPFDTAYVPVEYPTEAVDNMPTDYWPTED